MRAGVFDSGVGGLSVAASLLEHNLFEEIIYYGDTARVPYGIKDKNTIIRYAFDALEFFGNFDIDILIIACNSVSAYALTELQKHTSIPVVGVVEPGIKALLNKSLPKTSNILVIGTKATVRSQAYATLLKTYGFNNTTALATGLFVPLVEEDITSGKVLDSVLEYYFSQIQNPDAIILGCTHFPFIANEIAAYFDNHPVLIHSGEAIVEYLKHTYNIEKRFEKTAIRYFASENPSGLKKIASKWLKL